jgi:cytochrome c
LGVIVNSWLLLAAAAAISNLPERMGDGGGDIAHGQIVYEERCEGCHALDANRVGPAHRGVYGRRAGTAVGYNYSPGLMRSRIVWTGVNLDRWLRDPRAMVPETRMAFRLSDPKARADVIAYLRAQSSPAPK